MSTYQLWERPLSHSATLGDLVASDFISPDSAKVIVDQVRSGRDIVVYGPRKSGRTSLAAALCTMVPLKTAVGIPSDTNLTLDRQGLHSVDDSAATDLRVVRDVTTSDDLGELTDPDVSVILSVTAPSLADARKVLADLGASPEALEHVGVWVGLSVEPVKRLGKRSDRRFVSSVTLSTPNGDRVVSEGFIDPSGRPRHDTAPVVIQSAPLLPEPSTGEIVLGVDRDGDGVTVPVASSLQVAGGTSKERVEIVQGVVRQLLAQGWSVLLQDELGLVARRLEGLAKVQVGSPFTDAPRQSLSAFLQSDTQALVDVIAPNASMVKRTLLARFVTNLASAPFVLGPPVGNGTTGWAAPTMFQAPASTTTSGSLARVDPVSSALDLARLSDALFAATTSSLVRSDSEVAFLRECGAVLGEVLSSELFQGEGRFDPSGAGLTVLGGKDVYHGSAQRFLSSLVKSWKPGSAPGRAFVVASGERAPKLRLADTAESLSLDGVTVVVEGTTWYDLPGAVRLQGREKEVSSARVNVLGSVPEEVHEVRMRAGVVVSDEIVRLEPVSIVTAEEIAALGKGEFFVGDGERVQWCDTTRSLPPRTQHKDDSSSKKLVLGVNRFGNTLLLSEDELKMHAAVFGSAGSGKTIAVQALASGLLDLGWDGTILDFRGDIRGRGSMGEWSEKIAATKGLPHQQLLVPGGSDGAWLNPLSGLDADEIRNLLVSLGEAGSAYWDAVSRKVIGQTVNLFLDSYHVDPLTFPFPTIQDLGSFLSAPSLPSAAKKRAVMVINSMSSRSQDDYHALLRPSKDEVTSAAGLAARLSALYDSESSKSVFVGGPDRSELDMHAKGLTYVGVDGIGCWSAAQVVAPAVVQKTLKPSRDGEVLPQRFLLVDDAQHLNPKLVTELLSRARSARVAVILVSQSPIDWDRANERFFPVLAQNVNVVVAMSQGEVHSAAVLSEHLSSKRRGPGSISPDELRRLSIGEAVVKTSRPADRLSWCKVRAVNPE